MEFKVPKFLERETKFFYLLTFKQLAILGTILLGLFIFYYLIPKTTFIVLILLIGGITISLMVITIEDIPLYQLVGNFFTYIFSSKKYVWQRKSFPIIKLLKKEKKTGEEEKEKVILRISPESKFKDLSAKIERGTY